MRKKIMAILTAIFMIATMVAIPVSVSAENTKLWTAGGFKIGKATFYFSAPTVIDMKTEKTKSRLVYQTDEAGNYVRDAEGKRQVIQTITERQKVAPDGSLQIKRNKEDGTPILDADGNTIPITEPIAGALLSFKAPVASFIVNFAETGKATCVEGDLWYALFPKAKAFITGIDDGDILKTINPLSFSGVADPTDDYETLNPNIASDVGVNKITLELEAVGDPQFASLAGIIDGDPQQQNEIVLTTDSTLKDINQNATTTKGKIVGTFKSRTTLGAADFVNKSAKTTVILELTPTETIKGDHDLYLNFIVKVPQPDAARLPETKSVTTGKYTFVSNVEMQKIVINTLPPTTPPLKSSDTSNLWLYLSIGGGALVLIAVGAVVLVLAKKKKN